MITLRIILFIVILSECWAWWYGAMALWRSRNKDTGQRTTLGILLAFSFTGIGIAQVVSTIIGISFIEKMAVCVPQQLAVTSLFTSTARSAMAWTVALVVASGDSPGPLRRRVNRWVEQFK